MGAAGGGDDQRRGRAGECAREHVDRVVHADEDAVEADAGGEQGEQRAEAPVEDGDGDGGGEGDGGVVAREGVVGAVVDEEQRLLWMVDEGPRVVPELPEGRVRDQRQAR